MIISSGVKAFFKNPNGYFNYDDFLQHIIAIKCEVTQKIPLRLKNVVIKNHPFETKPHADIRVFFIKRSEKYNGRDIYYIAGVSTREDSVANNKMLIQSFYNQAEESFMLALQRRFSF